MSDGNIVSIPTYGVPFVGYTGDEIKEQFTYFKEYAELQSAYLEAAITDLQDIVTAYDPSITPVDIDIPTIDGPPFPTTPNYAALVFEQYPDTLPSAPILMPYGDLDFEYVAPTLPAEISANFDWSLTAYTSEMWEALFNKVHGDILNGGTGLTDAVHAAIVEREQEARRINQDREYQSGLDAVGATGFNLPSGHVAAFQSEFQREMLLRDQDALNNLLIKDFDLATENTRFAVTTGKELEQMLRATWEAVERMGLEAAIAANAHLVAVYEANIRAYIAQWDAVRIELEALKTKVDAIVAYNDGQVKVYLGQSEVYETQVKAVASENESIVKVRATEVETYKTEVQAIAVQYEALAVEVKAQIEAAALEVQQAIENSKIDLSAYVSETTLAERIAESIASIAAQSVASALGAINTSMSQGYSSSEGRSESWGHSESLGESHTFKDV